MCVVVVEAVGVGCSKILRHRQSLKSCLASSLIGFLVADVSIPMYVALATADRIHHISIGY